jgi:hypothetical protein
MTPDEYVANVSNDHRPKISEIRETINQNIPQGFEECVGYGMLAWVVPHSIYPPGYHVDPKKPLGLIMLASQKNYIALYHMGMMGGPLVEWFKTEWPKHSSRKLDMGKSCIRFKKPDEVPIDLIAQLAGKLTPQEWVAAYEKALGRTN